MTPLRIALLLAGALLLTGFNACDDDPLLDSGGGTGCAGSHCSARVLPDDAANPETF